ncbi:MAG: hypothetical protein V1649_04260 [Patescibacteria group bacterium]
MAIFYKCDKSIKGKAIAFYFDDMNKKFFEKSFDKFEFCEKCLKFLLKKY